MSWRHVDREGLNLDEKQHYRSATYRGELPGLVRWENGRGYVFHPDDGSKPFNLVQNWQGAVVHHPEVWRG